jgi:hypothetical protein
VLQVQRFIQSEQSPARPQKPGQPLATKALPSRVDASLEDVDATAMTRIETGR